MVASLDGIITGNQLPTAAAKSQSVMGKDDFLKLLMLQMQNQDPLNPMDNQAMTAQMAQFSSLEQMSNLNKNFTESNVMSAFMDATRLLGKQVEIFDPSSTPENPTTLTRKVQSVTYSATGPILQLDDGQTTTVQQILKVNEPTS